MDSFPQRQFPHIDPSDSGITILHPQARALFERARQLCGLQGFFARLRGQERRMPLLNLSPANRISKTPPKLAPESVPIKQIKGSVNRSEDFDCDFYPLHDGSEWRWVRIASMMLQGTPLPPVDLIQVGYNYYVMDGHHRVSVAHMLKIDSVDAMISAAYEELKENEKDL